MCPSITLCNYKFGIHQYIINHHAVKIVKINSPTHSSFVLNIFIKTLSENMYSLLYSYLYSFCNILDRPNINIIEVVAMVELIYEQFQYFKIKQNTAEKEIKKKAYVTPCQEVIVQILDFLYFQTISIDTISYYIVWSGTCLT